MGLNDKSPYVATLDVNGARTIYNAIQQFDSEIDKHKMLIDNANLDIVQAMGMIDTLYAERKSLSDQLDKFAPSGFMEPVDNAVNVEHVARNEASAKAGIAPMPPAVPAWGRETAPPMPFGFRKPWHRDNPAPRRTYPTPRARQQETDNEF